MRATRSRPGFAAMTSTPEAQEEIVAGSASDFNTKVIEEFRANGGRVGGPWEGTTRAALWPKLVAQYPSIGEYQARTARQIPVFMLTRPLELLGL
jgi:hypothetical protein